MVILSYVQDECISCWEVKFLNEYVKCYKYVIFWLLARALLSFFICRPREYQQAEEIESQNAAGPRFF